MWKDFITPAAVRGFWTAAMAGLATGATVAATTDTETGILAGVIAFAVSNGGRIVEGARDGVQRRNTGQ